MRLARGLHDPVDGAPHDAGHRRTTGSSTPSPSRTKTGQIRSPSIRTTTDVDFLDLVTEVIDLRSFSNLWYWIVLAILWSSLSHWTLGVPYHVVARARRGDQRAQQDMHALAEINGARILAVTDQSAAVLIGLATFIASGLAVTGWIYRVEFLQAVFLLVFPAMLVGALTIRTARRLRRTGFEAVDRELRMHRIYVQMLGVVFIFLTAFWGMYTNPVLHIARDDKRAEAMARALAFFDPTMPVLRFPGWDCLPYDRVSPNPEVSAARMATLAALAAGRPGTRFVLLTTLNAATQYVPARDLLREAAFVATVGGRIDEAALRPSSCAWASSRRPR
jgi:hypothetical protein